LICTKPLSVYVEMKSVIIKVITVTIIDCMGFGTELFNRG